MIEDTYGIKGLPRPEHAVKKTKTIPYVPGLPVRYEISELASSKDEDLRKQWTLFVLALDKFKSKKVDEKLSYFQVAGIHGYPETEWDYAPAPRQDKDVKEGDGEQPFGGYCNHNGLNFPTWHRPYMVLFEQCIWDNMQVVIKHWHDVHKIDNTILAKWRAAADQWRMPYWDWARRQTYAQDFAYPKILTQASVRIFPPDELKEYYPTGGQYANPFWGFENPEKDHHGDPLPFGDMPKDKEKWNIKDDPNFHAKLPPQHKKDDQWIPWSRTTGVSRYGITLTKDKKDFRGLDGVNNPFAANIKLAALDLLKENDPNKPIKDLKENPGTLADAVHRMFSNHYNTTWGEFASTKWNKEGNTNPRTGYMSLEYIHNNVHNVVGGTDYDTGVGHMSDVPVAAFDPIFWLHHVQVDRLLAIWQCLYPKLWWDKEEKEPEMKIPEKPPNVADDKPTDLLQPFHTKDKGDVKTDVWTAELCRDWTELNYQYDDLMAIAKCSLDKKGNLDEELYKRNLAAHIDHLYPSTASLLDELLRHPARKPDGLFYENPESEEEPDSWNDYIINIIYDRYALGGQSYAIEFFLGGPEDEKDTNFKPNNYVGQVYNFGGGKRSASGSCSNCKKQSDAGVLSRGQIPLTIQLVHHACDKEKDHSIKDFNQIEKYLENHLDWRYIGPGGAPICASKFPNTQVKVLCGRGQLLKAQPVPVLPPASKLKPAFGPTHGFQSITVEEPTEFARPAIYTDYQEIELATKGKSGLKL